MSEYGENNPIEDINDMIDDIENDIKFLCDMIEEAKDILKDFFPKKKLQYFEDIYNKYFGN